MKLMDVENNLLLERANFQINRGTLENLHSLQDRLQDADTWRDVLQKKLRESEIKSKNLRDQQRALREHKVSQIRNGTAGKLTLVAFLHLEGMNFVYLIFSRTKNGRKKR